MTEDSIRSTSRRTFVKCGALSTGALVGVSGTTAAVDDGTSDSDGRSVDRGVMLPYQLTPEHTATVVESGLDWQPDRFEDEYLTHVIAYDHAPSYRAYLFTKSNDPLEPDRSLEVGRVRGSPVDGNRFVTVGLE